MKFRNEVYKLGSGGARQILSLINTGGTQSRQSTLGNKYSCLTSIQLTVKQHPSTTPSPPISLEFSSHGRGGVLVLWVRALPELRALPQDSTPTKYYHTRQIRITFIVLVDVSVKS